MEYIQELIKKELSKIKNESEIFSSYKKSRNSLIKKISDNDDEKNWYKRARSENYILVFADEYDGSLIDKIKAKIGIMKTLPDRVDVTYEHIAKDTKTKSDLPKTLGATENNDKDKY